MIKAIIISLIKNLKPNLLQNLKPFTKKSLWNGVIHKIVQ